MDQIEIDKINNSIPFVECKIYWKENEWTSKFWEQLYERGWRLVKSEEDSEMIVVQNEQGRSLYTVKDKLEMLKVLYNMLI